MHQVGRALQDDFHKSLRFKFPTSLYATKTAGNHTTKIPTCNIQKKAPGATRLPITAPR